jgi:hypothetical protein
MRRQIILYLISRMPPDPPVQRPSNRPMFKSSHRGPSVQHGTADPEMVRQLVLSIRQQTLLDAGYIRWAGFDLTPYIATLPREVLNDPAKN